MQSSEDLTLKIWDARLMGVVQEMKGGSQIFLDCDAAPDGLHVAGCSHGFDGDGCDAQVFDRRSAKQISHLRGHESSVATCCFLPGESVEPRPGFLATGACDAFVYCSFPPPCHLLFIFFFLLGFLSKQDPRTKLCAFGASMRGRALQRRKCFLELQSVLVHPHL